MKKVLIGLFAALALSQSALASPIQLFTPIDGSPGARLGQGLACVGHAAQSPATPGTADFGYGEPGISNSSGRMTIVSGTNGSTTVLSDTPGGNPTGWQFGFSMAGIGDIDGDGFGEFVVGVPGFRRVMIYPSTPTPVTGLVIDGGDLGFSIGSKFGYSVAGLFGDLNNNGFNDFIVGIPFHTPVSSPDGAISVFDSSTGNQNFFCEGQFQSGEEFGTSVSGIGDVDSDNVVDYLVGAPAANSGKGNVYILSGKSSSDCVTLRTVSAGSANAAFGASLSDVGDINKDGVHDFVVGAPNDSTLAASQGAAFLISGATGAVLCRVLGTAAGDNLGTSVAGIGDFDGDGLRDFAVGSPGSNGSRGQVQVFTYNAGTSSCSLLGTLQGRVAGEQFGNSVAGSSVPQVSCDMTGDNNPEFLVGSANDGAGAQSGAVYVFTNATPTPTPTPANLPSKARLSFKLYPNGHLQSFMDLDTDPAGRCTVTLFGRKSNYDRTRLGNVLTLIDQKASRKSTQFNAYNLPKPTLDSTCGKPFIYHLIAKNQCGAKTFFSNVASRFLTCGKAPAVKVQTWERTLQARIR